MLHGIEYSSHAPFYFVAILVIFTHAQEKESETE